MRPLAYLFAALVLAAPALSFAQNDVAAASAAFAEAQKAQLRGDHSRAAELFEIADQSAPSAAALRSAIRNRETAGQDLRAATLALRALERYPEDKETRELAEGALARLAPKLTRVKATCSEPCRITVDGALVAPQAVLSREFFVTPGAHEVQAQWPQRKAVSRAIEAKAGEPVNVAIEAPALEPAEPASDVTQAPSPSEREPIAPSKSNETQAPVRDDSGGGLPPAVFWVGTGLTVVAGGLLTWSGLDTLEKRDAYEAEPTRAGYEDGVDVQRRTNILAGVTAGLGVGTILIGLFATDWDGEASLEASPSGVAMTYRGRLP